jgi:hypothetical protein
VSDELSLRLFPTWGKVYVWRISKEAYNPECQVPAVKHGEVLWWFWSAVSWYSILLFPLLHFMAKILQGSTWTGFVIRCIPWLRHYLQIIQFSKMTVSPFTQLELFSHGLKSTKVHFSIIPGQQSLDVNSREPLQFWRVEWGTDTTSSISEATWRCSAVKNGNKNLLGTVQNLHGTSPFQEGL